MENMELYNAFKAVPENAKKPIKGGRLSGKTDINPMYRIKSLTERFGPVGIGWYYDIDKMWLEQGDGGEISTFIQISLYYKVDGEWSKPVIGIGGNAFVAKEKAGLYTSDECYKMALTDAISVACKALGMGADVYWETDRTKYSQFEEVAPSAPTVPEKPKTLITKTQAEKISGFYSGAKLTNLLKKKGLEKLEDMSFGLAADLIQRCEARMRENAQSEPQEAAS